MSEYFTLFSEQSQEILAVVGISLTFLLLAVAARLFWARILSRFLNGLEEEWRCVIVLTTRRFVVWALLLLSIHSASAGLAGPRLFAIIDKLFGITWVALIIVTLWRLFNGSLQFYARRAEAQAQAKADNQWQARAECGHIANRVGLITKIFNIVLLALGLLYVLRALGVDITPLVASSAVGGLAVALALQDTFSNLIAGFLLNMDRPFQVGDYVKLESGEEGFVEEIGWRTTRLRLLAGNLVVLPNSTISQTNIINYHLPRTPSVVELLCGVAYDSDLQHVEDVAIEVSRETVARVIGGDTEFEPVMRWREFADSSINFAILVRVTEVTAQYELRSEWIKAIHRRFGQENIEIPFPIRTIVMKNTATKSTL